MTLQINFNFFLEFLHRNFKVINDQPVKIEPREQTTSPYNAYPGNYREQLQSTPSPQPLSPPMFVHVSPSPSPMYNNNANILQNQLQATTTRATMQNNFQQQPQSNQIYTPNILTTPNVQTSTNPFASGSNAIWTNHLNGNEASSNRAFYNNNNMPSSTSAIFNQLPLAPNITQNFNVCNEPMRTTSSILIDLDSQLLNNLSGELQSLSFSDFAMDSFSKTDDKSKPDNK